MLLLLPKEKAAPEELAVLSTAGRAGAEEEEEGAPKRKAGAELCLSRLPPKTKALLEEEL